MSLPRREQCSAWNYLILCKCCLGSRETELREKFSRDSDSVIHNVSSAVLTFSS